MSNNLLGKKIIVTGAGRGIGRVIAEELCKSGAIVYAISRTKSTLDELKSEFPSIHIIPLDISNWNDTREAVEAIGLVDGVVNNAAVLRHMSLLDSTPEEYDRQWRTNVAAILNISQVVAKAMIAAGRGGSIVNISSCLASGAASPAHGLYASTKAAVERLTKSMALEWGPYSIRANCVAPALVETDMGMTEKTKDLEAYQEYIKRLPMGRILQPQDIVGSVVFLLSDASGQITGETVAIDGGLKCT